MFQDIRRQKQLQASLDSRNIPSMSTLAGPTGPIMGVSHNHHNHTMMAAAYYHQQHNNGQAIGISNSGKSGSSSGTNGSNTSGGGSNTNGFSSSDRTSPIDVQPDRPIGYGAFGVVW